MANNTSGNLFLEVFFMGKRIGLLALLLLLFPGAEAQAASVESGSVYRFTREDFGARLEGAALLEIPDTGTLCCGGRSLRPGDVLTKAQLESMTFTPDRTEADLQATLVYLPVSQTGLESEAALTLGIRGRENKPPVAEDSTLETYKNLPNNGTLRASDPEGEKLSFTVTRQPRRGSVELGEDGSFTYTPKSNKVGVDSFAYTASDPGGKTSREATVTITILRPTESTTYIDTVGTDCRFTAEWMRSSGIFSGEKLGGNLCFQPKKEVTKGEFLTMVVKTLGIPIEDTADPGKMGNLPQWLRPYATAALRAGLTDSEGWKGDWNPEDVVQNIDAAALLCGALDLDEEPDSQNGALLAREIVLPEENLTRQDAANALYRLRCLKEE